MRCVCRTSGRVGSGQTALALYCGLSGQEIASQRQDAATSPPDQFRAFVKAFAEAVEVLPESAAGVERWKISF
jgi:hypothetical protein